MNYTEFATEKELISVITQVSSICYVLVFQNLIIFVRELDKITTDNEFG